MGKAGVPRTVECDACGRQFKKVYWDMKPHLCLSCQRLGRDACVRCEGWCCDWPNEFGRLPVLDHEKERFGLKQNSMRTPCRYRDPESGYCMLQKRFRVTVCREFACYAMVRAARAGLAVDEGRTSLEDPVILGNGSNVAFRQVFRKKVRLQAGLLVYKARFPNLTDDELFVLWFLQACFVDDEEDAVRALVTGPHESGIHAVYIDDKAGVVFLVHGKSGQVGGQRRKEKREDVIQFVELGLVLRGDKETLDGILTGLDPPVRVKLRAARRRLEKRGYTLRLYYATLGGFAPGVREDVKRFERTAAGRAEIVLLDGRQVFALLTGFRDCFASPDKPSGLTDNAEGGRRLPGDLVANDGRQILIERELRKVGYQYLRKGQTKSEARRAASAPHGFYVKKEELARAAAACRLDPFVLKESIETLFGERYYTSIFESSDADYYLGLYWLMRRVELAARGHSERGFAKWLVLHFMWEMAGRDIRRNARRFREACEKPGSVDNKRMLSGLDDAIDGAYTAVLGFCEEQMRGPGAGAKDFSAFLAQKGRYEEFGSIWQEEAGKQKERFQESIERFVRALRVQHHLNYQRDTHPNATD